MKIIKKKTWPKSFQNILSGKKNFEVRLKDFEVEEGDKIILEEWNPEKKEYTGRSIEKIVSYVFPFDLDKYGQKEDIEKKGLYIIQF